MCMNQVEAQQKKIGGSNQWQKSLDTTQNVSSRARYGAKSDPNVASSRCDKVPTTIGTIIMSCLSSAVNNPPLFQNKHFVPSKYFPNIWQMHLHAVLRLIIVEREEVELSRRPQFIDGWIVLLSDHRRWTYICSLSRSNGNFPIGVSYSLQVERAHPSR